MAKRNTGDDDGKPLGPIEVSDADREKAGKWFERARDLGEKRSYDYAIEYYVNGLEFWPEAVEEACKPLHGCAVARKHGGGGKPGLKDTMKYSMSHKDPRRALLNALWLFGHDPDNPGFQEGALKAACRLRAPEMAIWVGGVLLRTFEAAPKTSAKTFQSVAGQVEALGDQAAEWGGTATAIAAFQMGMDFLSLLRRRVPKDRNADVTLRNLATKLTIHKGRYQDSESFRESMIDAEDQAELHDRDRSVQSDRRLTELQENARIEFEEDPDSVNKVNKYVDLLCRAEHESDEMRAIGVLVQEYKRTTSYRYKQRADDIRMKQLNRKRRVLEKAGKRDELKEHRRIQLRYELTLYKERCERYPTDLRVKFDYATRLFVAGRSDDAIPMLQAARSDPKNRSDAGQYIGRCFLKKGFFEEAIAAFKDAIADHEFDDDELALKIRYWLARTYEQGKRIDDARKMFGEVLQRDYNYRDVRARMEKLARSNG
ncbi:MAG: hypothetical protein IID36_05790 [Planctomycetes bacterium]|nr:hypothetical protein [Planctomycetota bacterium]